MKVIEGENTVYCDVDDTLVMWDDNFREPHEGAKKFLDPYDGSSNYLTPHKKHIELLKKYKGRGVTVIVWSAAGVKWAESVVKTLGLVEYVELVITKPNKIIDDLPVEAIFSTRIYLSNK